MSWWQIIIYVVIFILLIIGGISVGGHIWVFIKIMRNDKDIRDLENNENNQF